MCVCVCVCVYSFTVDSAVNEYLGIYSLGGKVTGSSLISAVAQVGLRVPTPHAEEVLSVHLRVPSPAPGGALHWLIGPLSARAFRLCRIA